MITGIKKSFQNWYLLLALHIRLRKIMLISLTLGLHICKVGNNIFAEFPEDFRMMYIKHLAQHLDVIGDQSFDYICQPNSTIFLWPFIS